MLLCGLLFADKSFKNYLLSHVETFLLLLLFCCFCYHVLSNNCECYYFLHFPILPCSVHMHVAYVG